MFSSALIAGHARKNLQNAFTFALPCLRPLFDKWFIQYDRWNDNNTQCLLLTGKTLGQLSSGAIGDALGRQLVMTMMMGLQIISSFGSACSFGLRTLRILYMWRFLLGVGCGDVRPISCKKDYLYGHNHTCLSILHFII